MWFRSMWASAFSTGGVGPRLVRLTAFLAIAMGVIQAAYGS